MKLRPSDGARLGKIRVAAFPTTLGFDGIKLWIASGGSSTVYLARASDGVLEELPMTTATHAGGWRLMGTRCGFLITGPSH